MKTENMLNLTADSEQLGGMLDMLSLHVNRVHSRYDAGKMVALDDGDLELVSGGRELRKSECPKCGLKTFVIRFKRFECTSCRYVRPFADKKK